jgi:uncharacterized protein DUF4239
MTMYWIYDLPTWLLAVMIVLVFVIISLVGLVATRPLVRRAVGGKTDHNDLVSFFLSAIGVFYGLALGLIAVATWENFTEVDELVSREAAALAGLYRDLDAYPQPLRGKLENYLREYTKSVIERDWPAHQRGQTPEDGTLVLDQFEDELLDFEPKREDEKIAHAQVIKTLDTLVEQRRLRLLAVNSGLPASLWSVVLIGALLNIIVTYLFYTENVKYHAVLLTLLATFIALLVFLTAAMDNPFRGEFSVSSDAYQTILKKVMAPKP